MKPPARARVGRALVAALLAAATAASAKDWVALNSQRWPPYYLDEPGRPGFAREVLQECVTAQGYEPRFSPLPIEKMYTALRSGTLDAQVLSYDPSRAAYVTYGKVPLFSDSYRPVVRAKSGIRIATLADFDRLRLGHLEGLRYAEPYHGYLLRRLEAGTVVRAQSNEQELRMLLDGEIDVFVGLASTARWLARSIGAAERIAVLPYDVKTGDYFLGVSQRSRIADRQRFLDGFDRCLQQLRQDGRYQRLLLKYGLD